MIYAINNPLPVKPCCDSIQKAWDSDLIGFLTKPNGKSTMQWFSYSLIKETQCSDSCIFCGKKLISIKDKL